MTVSPFGTWKSPISEELVATGSVPLSGAICCDGVVYGLEGRPSEAGRSVLVRYENGTAVDLLPPGFDIRSRVHEYGGGSVRIDGRALHFINFEDQRIYRLDLETDPGTPEPVTPIGLYRYADGVPCRNQPGRYIYVREDHTIRGAEATNTIVRLRMDGADSGTILLSGYDFYSSPKISPDGNFIAWLSWNHPNMPWDGTELWKARLTGDGIVEAVLVAGGANESIFQPEWSLDGELHYVSDRNGWWNIYRDNERPIVEMEAEFGVPQWGFGITCYGFMQSGRIVATYSRDGRWFLAKLDEDRGSLEQIDLPWDNVRGLSFGDATKEAFVYVVSSAADKPTSILEIDVESGPVRLVRSSGELAVPKSYLSIPEAITYPTTDGEISHAFYYEPKNPDFRAPDQELPPIIVISHGGPTTATAVSLDYAIQYWCSRGFGILDVNYRGSSGYGRAYRQRLLGHWGSLDVSDCADATNFLVATGRADPDRLIVRGGSAGGYTTLCALTFTDTFSAGASLYGISDLETLARDTHKFESRYLDSLIGPYPDEIDLYRERSPIHSIDRISSPLILFQGAEDRVVPRSQSKKMYEAVKSKGIPVAYVEYQGEHHGFRKAENQIHCKRAELEFYGRVLGFESGGEDTPLDPPVEIANLGKPDSNDPG